MWWQPDDVVTTLSDLLDMSSTDSTPRSMSDKRYVLLKRPVSAEMGDEFKRWQGRPAIQSGGVDMTPIAAPHLSGRVLGAQVLGFVAYNHDGQQVGYFGVEGFYNDLLAGRSVRGIEQWCRLTCSPIPTPDQGTDVFLTIDRDIQFLVEVTMADAMTRTAPRAAPSS